MRKKIIFTVIGFVFLASALAQIKVNSSGMGIGLTNPEASLHLRGGSGMIGLRMDLKDNPGGNNSPMIMWDSRKGGANWFFTLRQSGNKLLFERYTSMWNGRVELLEINALGGIGIGRYPDYKLDVNGSIRVVNTVYSSDERLKTDIKPLTDEKDRLYLLEGKSYKKMLMPVRSEESSSEPNKAIEEISSEQKEKTEFPEYGYLAQELKEIFPDLVDQDSEGYYSVNYVGLIPVIVEAMKDQKFTIENLQQEIQQKTDSPEESKINELLQKVESLERAMAMCCSTDKLRSSETSFQQFDLNPASSTEDMVLYQNAPNPFNENTTIQCYIPQTVKKVKLCVYDMQGVQQKCLLIPERGTVVVQIQAGQLAAGIYTYLLIGDDKASEAKQMILTR